MNSQASTQPQQNTGGKSNSKPASATTSPIKDTIRGSQEMIKKLMSKDRSGLSSSSSEKVTKKHCKYLLNNHYMNEGTLNGDIRP